MIYLGLDDATKSDAVARYCGSHAVRKVIILAPDHLVPAWSLPVPHEVVRWGGSAQNEGEIVQYKFYYRLLQEIDSDTLIVVNELLRTQERHCLKYNCVRHYLQQAGHALVFQHLPILDALDDLMILFDFATRSRWKREPLTPRLLREVAWHVASPAITFRALDVPTDAATRERYAREKRALLDGLGLGDPHTIPRNLALVGGKAKAAWALRADEARRYLGRNDRLKLANLDTYDRAAPSPTPYTVLEFCHRHLDFADAVTTTGQTHFDVLVSDLKVDRWYFERFTAWAGRVRDACAIVRGT